MKQKWVAIKKAQRSRKSSQEGKLIGELLKTSIRKLNKKVKEIL